MQKQLMTLPDHEFHYVGSSNYYIKCNLEQGNFYSSVWKRTGEYYRCPCCGGSCKK
jgi:hypothetical protein